MTFILIKSARYVLLTFLVGLFSVPLIMVVINVLQYIFSEPDILSYYISSAFWSKFSNSVFLSLTVSLLTVSLGLFLAYVYFGLKKIWQRAIFGLTMLIVFSTSPVIYLVAWSRLDFFNALPVFIQAVIVLTFNLSPIPFGIFIFMGGAISISSLNVAFLSAKIFSVVRYIIIPQLFIPLAMAFSMVFMLVITNQEIPSFLGYRTYAEEFLSRIVVTDNLKEASVAAIPFMVLGCLMTVLLTFFASKTHLYSLNTQAYKPLLFTLVVGLKTLIFSTAVLITIIFSIYFSLVINVDYSLLLFTIENNSKAIINSLSISIISSLMSVFFAHYIYEYCNKSKQHLMLFFWLVIMLFYWLVPSSLSTLGLIWLSNLFNIHSAFYEFSVLIFGYQTKYLPFALLVLTAVEIVWRKPDNTTTNLLNVSGVDKFTKLIFPMYWAKWTLIITVVTIFALNDLSVTLLLIPPGVETIVIKIYNLMHYGDYSVISLLSLIQISLVSLIVLFSTGIIKMYDKS